MAHKIDFYDIQDLQKVTPSSFVTPFMPKSMCTKSPNSIFFEDSGKIFSLDCARSPPRLEWFLGIPCFDVLKMVCVTQAGTQLLVAVVRRDAAAQVRAFDTSTLKMKWKLSSKVAGIENRFHPRDVTADKTGHVYVQDAEEAVHKFSFEGDFVGTVLRSGQQGIGDIRKITWSSEPPALVVVHRDGEHYRISVVKI